jgi:hypothetical protein
MNTLIESSLYNSLTRKEYNILCVHKVNDNMLLCDNIPNLELLSSRYFICKNVNIIGLEGNKIHINYYPVSKCNININTIREGESYNNTKYIELSTVIKNIGKPYNDILNVVDNNYVCTDLYDKDYMENFKELLKNNYNNFGYNLKDEELVYTFNVKRSMWWLSSKSKMVTGTGIASLDNISFMYWYDIHNTKVNRIYAYNKLFIEED